MLYLLRFIFIFFLVVYVVGLIFRLVLRHAFKRVRQRHDGYGHAEKRKTEGEVHLGKPPQKEKIVDKNIGEYVDYEEVKE